MGQGFCVIASDSEAISNPDISLQCVTPTLIKIRATCGFRISRYQHFVTNQMVRNFPEPKRFTLDCPTQQILDIIANKWSVIVLYCLAYGSKRYTESPVKVREQ